MPRKTAKPKVTCRLAREAKCWTRVATALPFRVITTGRLRYSRAMSWQEPPSRSTLTREQVLAALSVLSDVRQLAISIGWTLLLWLSVALGNLLVCRAFGLQFGMSQVIFVLGWSMVGSAVPTPGGAAGAFHAATGAALVLLGVGRDQAAAVAIILHLVDFAPAALFGLFYFLRGDINIARLRALTTTTAVEHAVEDEKVVLAEGA